MIFDLEKSNTIKPVRLSSLWIFRFSESLFKFFLAFSGLSLLVFFSELYYRKGSTLIFGISLVSLGLFIFFRLCFWFKTMKLMKPKIIFTPSEALNGFSDLNVFDLLSFRSVEIIQKAYHFAKKSGIDSSHLLLALIEEDKDLRFVFSRALLSSSLIKKDLQLRLKDLKLEQPSLAFENSILEAMKAAASSRHEQIEPGDLLVGLAKNDSIFRSHLLHQQLRSTDIELLVRWLNYLLKEEASQKRFWEAKNLLEKGSVAKEWAAGYTITLDRYSFDLTEASRLSGYPETIGHEEAVREVERVLSRENKKAVLIVGDPGSGRKSIAMAIARKASLRESLMGVNNKRVVQLDLNAVLAGTQSSEEVEALLNEILEEVAKAGDVILVIDEFHNFVGSHVRPGALDITAVLSPYLISSSLQIIGITSHEGFSRQINQNASILNSFETVEVYSISKDDTLKLLENMSFGLERKYKKAISFPALRDIIDHCDKYMASVAFPEKAMTMLEELMVYLGERKEEVLLPKHVAQMVFEKTRIPVGEIEENERNVLLNLEDLIHERIINQEEAVKEISNALRRARAEVTSRKGTMGNFLFLGPTGVGKTETAKALAAVYFGAEERMIRLDMSEFQSVTDISRLIGDTVEPGILTTQVREKPFSLILLDEIEKAHTNILNLFLQILDEGFVTDGLGRRVDFKNTIIIATSNAGYQLILEALKSENGWLGIKERLTDYLFKSKAFRPEFLNRFDGLIVFKPLTKANIEDIAGLMLKKVQKGLREKDIDLVITDELKEKMAELGYDPIFGARQMNRVIQDKVENSLASGLLSGKIRRGSVVEVNPETFELNIR